MKRFFAAVYFTDRSLHIVSGVVLALMMALTLCDVILRNIGHPIVGSMEIIQFAGSVVVGFAIPYTTLKKSHVFVDMLIGKLSPAGQRMMNAITRIMGILLFVFIGINFIIYGFDLIRTGEVSAAFRLPYYPIAFGLAFSCFLESLTLLAEFFSIIKGDDHE